MLISWLGAGTTEMCFNPSRLSTTDGPLKADTNTEVKLPLRTSYTLWTLLIQLNCSSKLYYFSLLGNTHYSWSQYYLWKIIPAAHWINAHTDVILQTLLAHSTGGKGGSSSQQHLETLRTQTCSSVPAWAPGPAAKGAAPPAGSWPGTAWPSAHSNYLHGLALWMWISETPPRSPGWKHQRIQNGHYWLQTGQWVLFLWGKKHVPDHWGMKQDWLSPSM